MSVANDVRQRQDHPGDAVRSQSAPIRAKIVQIAAQIATGDVFILQARRVRLQRGVLQTNDARVYALLHH